MSHGGCSGRSPPSVGIPPRRRSSRPSVNPELRRVLLRTSKVLGEILQGAPSESGGVLRESFKVLGCDAAECSNRILQSAQLRSRKVLGPNAPACSPEIPQGARTGFTRVLG